MAIHGGMKTEFRSHDRNQKQQYEKNDMPTAPCPGAFGMGMHKQRLMQASKFVKKFYIKYAMQYVRPDIFQ